MRISEVIQPVKGTVKSVTPDKVVVTSDNKEITIDTKDPKNLNAIQLDPQNPGQFKLDFTTQSQPQSQLKPGSQISLPTDNSIPTEDIGGDPTDDFIDDVVDTEFEKFARQPSMSVLRRLSGIK